MFDNNEVREEAAVLADRHIDNAPPEAHHDGHGDVPHDDEPPGDASGNGGGSPWWWRACKRLIGFFADAFLLAIRLAIALALLSEINGAVKAIAALAATVLP